MRKDLLVVFIGMPLLLVLFVVLEWIPSHPIAEWPLDENLILGINALIIFVGLLSEAKSLQTKSNINSTGDTGFVSGIINIFSLLYVPVLDSFVMGVFPAEGNSLLFYSLGATVFLFGVWLRRSAVNTLGRHFNHSLIIISEHSLVETGLYKLIRHPAYLGSLCLMVGGSWMFLSHIGILVVIACFPLVVYRIFNEEKLLISHFGDNYLNYKKRTYRLIPYVY